VRLTAGRGEQPIAAMTEPSPEAQLAGFIAKYEPRIEACVWPILEAMRARLPGALELVYDNYQFLAIGYAPGERTSEAIFSIAVAPTRVLLCFLQNGVSLADPEALLRGSGNQVRNIILDDVSMLDRPAVQALMAEALATAKVPLDRATPYRLVIKSISAKQRPRRPKA
jgi:hypothetical protein